MGLRSAPRSPILSILPILLTLVILSALPFGGRDSPGAPGSTVLPRY
jgi:hypothetical protein